MLLSASDIAHALRSSPLQHSRKQFAKVARQILDDHFTAKLAITSHLAYLDVTKHARSFAVHSIAVLGVRHSTNDAGL